MSYPCHVCKDTMLDGVLYSSDRDRSVSPGKLRTYPGLNAAASSSSSFPPKCVIIDCPTCKGTGLVEDRRTRGERRSGSDRRRSE